MMANNMNSVLMQKKKRMTDNSNNNKRLSSRRIASATVVSVLSILSHPPSASAAASTGNGIDDTTTMGQRFRHALHKGEDTASSSMERLVAAADDDEKRELKKKTKSSSSAGSNTNNSNMPRRPPIVIDPTKRTHALPLNKKTALHSSSTAQGGDSRGGPMMLQNGNQLHTTPYYPSFTTSTCHNEEHSYPTHYLYDISAYFFHSPRECCEVHFATRLDHCIKGTINSGGNDEEGLLEGMGMKKGAYRARGNHDMNMGSGPTLSMSPPGPAIMAGVGKKKPMMHHDTSWHNSSMQPIYGDSWHGGGGGAGKPIRCPPIIPDDDWWGSGYGAQEHDYDYDDDDDWPSSWSGGGRRGRLLQWNYGYGNGGGNWDSKSNKSAKDAKNAKPSSSSSSSSSWHPPSQPSSPWYPSAGGGGQPPEPEHHWQAPPDHGPGHHFQVPDASASWQPGSKTAKHTKMSKSKGSKQSSSGDSWHPPPGGWYPPQPPPGGWDPSCFPTSPPEPTRKPTGSPIAATNMPTYAPTPGGSTKSPSYSPTIPPVVPTYSPSNPFPSYGPTGRMPTYAPTSATYAPTPGETVPTYSPSANATKGMPTYSPSKLDVTSALPTFAPTGKGSTVVPTAAPPTALPTFNPTTPVPSTESPGLSNMPTTESPGSDMPTTYMPSSGGSSSIPTDMPTNMPTPMDPALPTFVPTVSGTETPTYSPSTSSPTMEGNDFWMWGAPEAVGQDADADVLVPLNLGDTAVHTTAGPKYTIIVLNDGSALASGDIDSLGIYSGYLGLDESLVKKGINPFQPINQVLEASSPPVAVDKRMNRPRRLGHRKKLDRENNGMIPLDDHMTAVDAPKWAKAFAGVEQTPDSGIIHTVLLDTKGQAWATGSNSVGQLCLGDDANRMMPERIPIDGIVVDVAIGAEHTLLLLDDGTVYGCGSNAMGQLGLGKKQAGFSPMLVDSIKSPVSSISAGHSHSLFVAEDGIYVTGSNEYGQLCTDTAGQNVITPKALNIEERVATSFDAIKESSYILYEDGSVNSCGRNTFGQLGDGTEEDNFIVAVQLDGHVVNLLGVGPSAESAFFYTEDERVWGAGRNDRGQLGVGDDANRNLPSYVMFDGPVELDLLSVSECHTVALATVIGTFPPQTPTYMPSPSATSYEPTPIVTQSPTKTGFTMYFWGSPDSIGQDEPTNQIVPVESGDGVIDVGAGSKYTVMVLQDGTALSTGYVDSLKKYSGHLGIDTPDSVVAGINKIAPISRVYDADVMTIVDAPMFEKVFAGVTDRDGSGVIHTVLLDNKGQAWATGSNNAGQLCMGDSVDNLKIPQRIPVEGSVIDVAIGGKHTLLLLDDGSVYGCGSNAAGQLGLGETTETIYEPTLLDGLAAVSSISAGHSHSLFVAKDGIYFTGSNEFGQLCADTGGENLFSPESITGIDVKNIVSFEANKEASFLLYKDGSVNSCGNNEFGQLGDGTNQNQLLAEVELDDNIARLLGVGPSSESAFFVSEDEERVYASGLNDHGQLGTGDQENKNVPTFVRFEERVILETISASGDHTLALGYADGTFSPTGSDATDATDSPTESPTMVGTTSTPTVMTPAPATPAPTTSAPSSSPTIVVPPPTSEPTASPVSLATPTPTASPTYVVSPPTLSPAADTDVPTNVPTLSPNSDTPNPTLSDSPTIGVPSTNGPTPFDGGDSSVPTILVTTEVPTTKADGTEFYYWGAPESAGESGEDKTSPEPTDELFSDVAAGSRYSIKILPDGVAHSMGYIDSIDTYHGHLGLPGGDVSVGENAAKPITSVYDAENDQVLEAPFFVQAFAGAERESSPGSIHTLLIDEDGQAWVTGSNNEGQLCLGDFNDRLIPQQIPIDSTIVGAAVGSEHTLLLLEDGSVYGCGSNDLGQLGLGGNVESANIPTLIEGLGTVDGVSAGVAFSLFKADDALYATGSNTYGQLCDEDTVGDDVMSPIGLTGVDASSVSTFEAIKTSAFILFKDGSVGACGRNNFGQLGDNTNEDRVRTVIEPLPNDVAIRMLGVGPSSESAFFVNADGVTYATGLNDRGQLGVGDVNNRNALTMVSYGIAAQVPQKISASEDHTLSR